MNADDQRVSIFEIDEKRTQKWKKWCKLLNSVYKSELEKSLAQARTERELFVTFELHGKTYGLSLEEGNLDSPKSDREVSKIHQSKIKECLKPISNAKILYNLKIDPVRMYTNRDW